MILSTKKRIDIAEKCKRRLDILKRQDTTVTSVPKPGELDILKECYSEGSKPGILVELAKCKGLGKSKFAEIVKEMNQERKKFAKDFANQDDYYNIVTEIVSKNELDKQTKSDIENLKKLFKEIKDIQKEACEHACEQREAWHKLNDDGRYDEAERYGYYNKTIRENFKRTDILWFQQGLVNKVLFASVSSKSVLILEDGFTTWSNSFEEAKKLADRFFAARNEILTIFKNNKKLEPYLLTASNSKEAGKEIQSILKRIAERKNFVKKQSQEWGHYANKKGKNQPKEEWDKVKLEVAEYMSKLEWKDESTTESRLKEAFKNFRKKQNNYSDGGLTKLKKYLEEKCKPVTVIEAPPAQAQSSEKTDLWNLLDWSRN